MSVMLHFNMIEPNNIEKSFLLYSGWRQWKTNMIQTRGRYIVCRVCRHCLVKQEQGTRFVFWDVFIHAWFFLARQPVDFLLIKMSKTMHFFRSKSRANPNISCGDSMHVLVCVVTKIMPHELLFDSFSGPIEHYLQYKIYIYDNKCPCLENMFLIFDLKMVSIRRASHAILHIDVTSF